MSAPLPRPQVDMRASLGSVTLHDAATVVSSGVSPDGDATVGHWAWISRHERWPTTYQDVASAFPAPYADLVIPAARLCARRLQYNFAWSLLGRFSRAALIDYPTDPDFKVHLATSRAATSGDPDAWGQVRLAAKADPERWGSDFLTLAVVARVCDHETRLAALALARHGADRGQHVPAYRAVSLLRLLGRPEEAWLRLADAEELLATDPPYRSLFEHLSERLFAERLLLGAYAQPHGQASA